LKLQALDLCHESNPSIYSPTFLYVIVFPSYGKLLLTLFVIIRYQRIYGSSTFFTAIPTLFITYIVFVYILNAPIGFNLSLNVSFILGAVFTVILAVMFFVKARNNRDNQIATDVDVTIDKAA